MKVFLSWSGATSKAIAEILRDWLPDVIQKIDPWMSSEDIEKGAVSETALNEALEFKAGIICVTANNQYAPWLNFEAGALSKTVGSKLVCPYLFGIKTEDLKRPLGQFQTSHSNEDETFRLMKTLNKALQSDSLEEKRLKQAFDRCWPELKAKLSTVESSPNEVEIQPRPHDEIVGEILNLVREQSRQSRESQALMHFLLDKMDDINKQKVFLSTVVPPKGYLSKTKPFMISRLVGRRSNPPLGGLAQEIQTMKLENWITKSRWVKNRNSSALPCVHFVGSRNGKYQPVIRRLRSRPREAAGSLATTS